VGVAEYFHIHARQPAHAEAAVRIVAFQVAELAVFGRVRICQFRFAADVGKAELAIDVGVVGQRVVHAEIPACEIVYRQGEALYGGVLVTAAGAEFGVEQVGDVAADHQGCGTAPDFFFGDSAHAPVFEGGGEYTDIVEFFAGNVVGRSDGRAGDYRHQSGQQQGS